MYNLGMRFSQLHGLLTVIHPYDKAQREYKRIAREIEAIDNKEEALSAEIDKCYDKINALDCERR
jgi:peptidoglycan hydrolase CwlO-like protein